VTVLTGTAVRGVALRGVALRGVALRVTICERETILGNVELVSVGEAVDGKTLTSIFNQFDNFYNDTVSLRGRAC